MPLSGSGIGQKGHRHRGIRYLWASLMLAAAFCLIITSPATAQDGLKENFQFSYEPVSFEKREIHGGEVFHATIAGRVTCTKNLPISASEASITSRVIAVHGITSTEVTLNPSYTAAIKPFPSQKGETAEVSQAVPLQFPAQAEAGDYDVIGEIVEARVKVLFAWIDVTGYLPQNQSMGTVKYIATESAEALPIPAKPPSPEPELELEIESEPEPAPLSLESTASSADIPASSEPLIAWWGEMVVLIAAGTTIFNIVWFLRHRTR
jgi:hypothetical protein